MPTLNEDAAFLRLALVHGVVSVAEVVAWADAEIAALERPHPVLIEISTSGRRTPGEVAAELDPLASGCDDVKQMDRLFAAMYHTLSHDFEASRRIASTLYSFALSGMMPSGDASEGAMLYFDDALDLAFDGVYGTVDGVVHEMLRFLAPYAEFAAELPTTIERLLLTRGA
jgi:hypothetical protein